MKLRALFKTRPITKDAPPPSGGREITNDEYSCARSADDYNRDRLSEFRVARALMFAASGRNAITDLAEPGVLMLATAISTFKRSVTILEFGGGTGYHATVLNDLLPGSISRYVVVELPAQVRAANGRIEGVEFADHLPDGGIDIVFSSGALQSTHAPLDFLRRLCSLEAPSMVLTRNFFSDRQLYVEHRTGLFNHGAGPVPNGFTNEVTMMYMQSLCEKDFLDLVTTRYRKRAKLPNSSGVPLQCPDAYGIDYLFEARL